MIPGLDWSLEEAASKLKGSSFYLGSFFLDAQARADLSVFYAFCRAIDDCADELQGPEARRALVSWEAALRGRRGRPGGTLPSRLRELLTRRKIPIALCRELISGAKSDLKAGRRFKTRKELYHYCHQVAGVVGQACLPIFGIDLAKGARYAESLGRAMQITNILRDVQEDEDRGRSYIAMEDLKRNSEAEVFKIYADLAQESFREAARLEAELSKKALRPARMMRRIYSDLLDSMLKDGLRIREKRYQLSRARKLYLVFLELFS